MLYHKVLEYVQTNNYLIGKLVQDDSGLSVNLYKLLYDQRKYQDVIYLNE